MNWRFLLWTLVAVTCVMVVQLMERYGWVGGMALGAQYALCYIAGGKVADNFPKVRR